MTARLRATLLAAALFVAFAIALAVQPTGYLLFSPGPTVNILGALGSTPIVTVKGHPTYPDTGDLRMLTVSVPPPGDDLSVIGAIQHWIADDTSVLPSPFVYPPDATAGSAHQRGAQEMSSAQDTAKAAALRALGISVPSITQVVVAEVVAGGPSKGVLEPGDVMVSVGGATISSLPATLAAVRRFHPGDRVPVVVERGTKRVSVAIRAVAAGISGAKAHQARIGVELQPTRSFRFPFAITINIPDDITGPSAGMMLALSIYDKLTPGSLTGGHDIAGTGTIDAGGNVGAIGGIAQKLQGAQRDGAQLFLAPAANCGDVRLAHYDKATMRVVKVSTLADAIRAIKTWDADQHASLPGCS